MEYNNAPFAPLLTLPRRAPFDRVEKEGFVYILTNTRNQVLYTGVTSDLSKRLYEHRTKRFDGFSKKYNCWKLVYFEVAGDIDSAIAREKHIKAGSRRAKIAMIQEMNPEWKDLAENWGIPRVP